MQTSRKASSLLAALAALALPAIGVLGLSAIGVLGLGALVPAHADPTVTFTFAASNSTSSAVPFAFNVSLPASAPAGSLITVFLSGTFVSPAGGGSVSPYGQTFLLDAVINGADTGIGTGTAQTFGPDAGTYTYGPAGGFSASGLAAVPVTNLGVNLAFLLSAGSSVTFNGSTSVGPAPTTTPEPATVTSFALGGLGLLVLIGRARKRNTTASD